MKLCKWVSIQCQCKVMEFFSFFLCFFLLFFFELEIDDFWTNQYEMLSGEANYVRAYWRLVNMRAK